MSRFAKNHETATTRSASRPIKKTDPKRPSRPTGRRKGLRTDRLTTIWMALAIIVEPLVAFYPNAFHQPLWTGIHIITLGIVLTSIHQWSWHFAQGLLHLPPETRVQRAWRDTRVLLIHLGLLILLVGMRLGNYWVCLVGAVCILVTVIGHCVALFSAIRTPLASTFTPTMKFNIVALCYLALGIFLAFFMMSAMFLPDPPQWLVEARNPLTLAHAAANLWGFVGLTISGVLVTFGPTVLRCRADKRALGFAKRGLWPMIVIVGVIVASLAWSCFKIAALFEVFWLVGAFIVVGLPILGAARGAKRIELPPITMACALFWMLCAAFTISYLTFTATDAGELRGALLRVYAFGAFGGLVQFIMGAMEYLMPAVIGGGPSVTRIGRTAMYRSGAFRLIARNLALIIVFLSEAGPVRYLTAAVVMFTYVLEIVAFLKTGISQGKARASQIRAKMAVKLAAQRDRESRARDAVEDGRGLPAQVDLVSKFGQTALPDPIDDSPRKIKLPHLAEATRQEAENDEKR